MWEVRSRVADSSFVGEGQPRVKPCPEHSLLLISRQCAILCAPGMLDYFVKSTDLNTLDEVIAREQQPVDVVLDGGRRGVELCCCCCCATSTRAHPPPFLSLAAAGAETVWPLPHRLFPYE